jgi:hypothetical protein
MKRNVYGSQISSWLFFLLALTGAAIAQAGVLKGRVKDPQGNATPDATVLWVRHGVHGEGRVLRAKPATPGPDPCRAGSRFSSMSGLHAANVSAGKQFRRVKAWGDGLTEKAIWHVVRKYRRKTGIREACASRSSPLCRIGDSAESRV